MNDLNPKIPTTLSHLLFDRSVCSPLDQLNEHELAIYRASFKKQVALPDATMTTTALDRETLSHYLAQLA